MMNEEIQNIIGTPDNFWNAVKIYCTHPNSINKQILLSQHVFHGQLQHCIEEENAILEIYNNICHFLNFDSDISKSLKDLNLFTSYENSNNFPAIKGFSLLIRELIPKRVVNDSKYFEFLFCDKKKTNLIILTKCIQRPKNDCLVVKDPLLILKFDYISVQFTSNNLKIQYKKTLGEKGINWIKVKFLPKFLNLMTNTDVTIQNNNKNKQVGNLIFSNQVDIVEYYKVYERMKYKYAKHLIEHWTETTDPKKYVFEDIGIASYLLLLWNNEKVSNKHGRKQKFIDLGCGNGLLVHILNSEGHFGIGLDMRKRKIWDTFDSNKTILKEKVIIPTEGEEYPQVDWLIGNHSDELTPWIPIMAKQNSPDCQYFVLPCCPYQLNGQKFQRQNSSLSSYRDFISYVKGISDLCNFETYIDRLRIPSTKRICLIGIKKHELVPENINLIKNNVLSFIKSSCQPKIQQFEELKFKLREPVERVRNCTKLEQNLIDKVLEKVMNVLLKNQCMIKLTRHNDNLMWNRGEKMALREVAKSIEINLLKNLKKECKGLQTLLKNNHYLFEVKGGMVQFRSPEDLEKLSHDYFIKGDKSKWKLKKCWFHENHPNGCPLIDSKCSHKHSQIDVKHVEC